MDSPNIMHVPLNREGALELGESPCEICEQGWGTYSENKIETCLGTCEIWKRYIEKTLTSSR